MLWYRNMLTQEIALAETDNLVLEHLRHIRHAVDALREDMVEVKLRIGCLETEVVRLAEVSTRVDRLSARVDRIERRLDLAEA